MNFSVVNLVLLLFVVAGATKGAAFFAAVAGSMSMQERRAVIIKAMITQTVVLFTFAFFGQAY